MWLTYLPIKSTETSNKPTTPMGTGISNSALSHSMLRMEMLKGVASGCILKGEESLKLVVVF